MRIIGLAIAVMWVPLALAAEDLTTLREKAEGGDAVSQFELGMRFFEGDGVAKDEAEAATWFRRAAKQGHAQAKDMVKRLE